MSHRPAGGVAAHCLTSQNALPVRRHKLRGTWKVVVSPTPTGIANILVMMEGSTNLGLLKLTLPRLAEAVERHLETLLDNLRRFVTGQPLRNVVDKRRWC